MNMTLILTTDAGTTHGHGTLEQGMSALERLLTGENTLFEPDAPDPASAQDAYEQLRAQLS